MTEHTNNRASAARYQSDSLNWKQIEKKNPSELTVGDTQSQINTTIITALAVHAAQTSGWTTRR